MAEINLLGASEKPKGLSLSGLVPIANKGLAVLLLLILAYYGFLIYKGSKIVSDTEAVNVEIGELQNKLLNDPNRNELLTRQSQLKDLQRLAKNHFYWSILLKELPKMNLKTASLLNFTANGQAQASLVVAVPSYADLDKFMQVFDRPEVNKTFTDIKIKSVTKTEQESKLLIKAKIELKHRLDFIKKTDDKSTSDQPGLLGPAS
jgi:hypothetical protein